MKLAQALQRLYPAANPARDFRVQDDGDGPYIAHWDKAALGDQPSQEAIAAAIAALPGDGVPATVPTWKARAALKLAGKYEAAAQAVAASGNVAVQEAFEYGAEWHRASPAVAAMGAAIGMSSADIDALFIAADGIAV